VKLAKWILDTCSFRGSSDGSPIPQDDIIRVCCLEQSDELKRNDVLIHQKPGKLVGGWVKYPAKI